MHPVSASDGTLAAIVPLNGAPKKVTKRIVQDLDKAYFPTEMIVPSTEIVHDRANLEVFRGCIRGCRFCQAGYVYRPVRPRKPETIIRQGIESLKNTGYQEATLLSLSSSDYRPLDEVCDGLLEYCEPRSMSLALPSLRDPYFDRSVTLICQHDDDGADDHHHGDAPPGRIHGVHPR